MYSKHKTKGKKNLKFNLTNDEVNKTEIKYKRNHKRLYKMFELDSTKNGVHNKKKGRKKVWKC